jgi:hypothetical protein
MANLRADVLNELANEKYYNEVELQKLAYNELPELNYKEKVQLMKELTKDIVLAQQAMNAFAQIFPEQQAQQAPTQQAPQGEPTVSESAPVEDGESPLFDSGDDEPVAETEQPKPIVENQD